MNNWNEDDHQSDGKNKKCQLEIFGLVVLIIIILVGFLFFMVYRINNPSQNSKRMYMNGEVATNMILAMTKVNVKECYDHQLSQLIADCARTYSTFTCGELTSCEVVNMTILSILNSTLVEEGINYNFTISGTDISFSEKCGPNSVGKVQGYDVIPLGSGQQFVEITLDICNE